ncbi:unnamed protein product [marine sediment metagenome]|uniref:Uncharacterized protein n=1 Tax=marine sediment metagenome TaxID=412755 RepID=X0Z190_9ZZZZ
MQIVFVVTSGELSPNMKVFNYRPDAQKYQQELKKFREFKNATIYEKEVIE